MKSVHKLIKWDTFQGKLFAIMAGGTAATVLALTTLWIAYSWYAVSGSVQRDLQVIADRTAGEVDEYLSKRTAVLTAAKELLSYPSEDRFKLELMLKRLSLEFMDFRTLALFDAKGAMIVSGGGSEQTTYIDAGILETVKSGKKYTSRVLFTEKNIPYIRVALPLFWQGEVFRVLVADVDIMGMWNKIDTIRVGETGHAHIISREGVFLAASSKEDVLKGVKWTGSLELISPVRERSTARVVRDHEGRTAYAAYAEIPSTEWGLVVTQERREALAFLETMIYQAIAIIALSLLCGYFIASHISNLLSLPVYELYKGSKEIASGNFEYKVPKLHGSEFSTLGEMFNDMGVSLAQKKKTEEELAKASRLAAVGRLAADVAHEINNPLAIMKNYIYIISKKKMPPEDPNQQFLGIIDREIDRVAGIIRSFNDFYKGSQATSHQKIDVISPLREIVDFCKADMEAKGITIEMNLVDAVTAMGDRDKVKQVFLNLLKNASEAMPGGGKVTVDAQLESGKVLISVADTGTGIKQEHLGRIFDPFFSTKGVKGTGLGLSVSYGIIKGMNGNIEVESEEGKGTRFKVTLPVVST